MILLVYVGSIYSDLIGFTNAMRNIRQKSTQRRMSFTKVNNFSASQTSLLQTRVLCSMMQNSDVKFTLYPKKAGLVNRNIVHFRKKHSTLCRFLPILQKICHRVLATCATLLSRPHASKGRSALADKIAIVRGKIQGQILS